MADDPASDGSLPERLPSDLIPGYIRLQQAFRRRDALRRERRLGPDLAAREVLLTLVEHLRDRVATLPPVSFQPHGHQVLFSGETRLNLYGKPQKEGTVSMEALSGLADDMEISADQAEALKAIFLGSEATRSQGQQLLERTPIVIRPLNTAFCRRCGLALVFHFDGTALHAAEPCAYGDNWLLTVQLDVPSGLICASPHVPSLFRLYGASTPHHPFWEQPYQTETAAAYFDERSQAFTEEGCVSLSFNAARPAWYAHTDHPDRFTIAHTKSGREASIPPTMQQVRFLPKADSGIMLADFDLVSRRWNGKGRRPDRHHAIPVPSGRYRFTNLSHQVGFAKRTRSQPFQPSIEIERIGPASTLPPRVGSRTAGQVFHHFQRNALSSRGYDPFVFLREVFTEDRFRRYWRREGYPQFSLRFPASEPEAELPSLDLMLPVRLMPTSALVLIIGSNFPLNPSMHALARDFLACIVKHGVTANEKGIEFFPSVCVQQRALAAELLAKLEQRSPESF